MKEAKTQAQKRRPIVAKDQFGRPWGGSIEIESGDFTGLVKPAGWTDPMKTPPQYVRIAKNEWGHPELGRVEIDVERWIKDQKRALQDWIRNFWKVGKELYAVRFDPKEHADDPYLLEAAGPRPHPSITCIEVLNDPNHRAHRALLGLEPMNEAAHIMLGNDPLAMSAIERATQTVEERAKEEAAKHKLTVIQFLALEPSYQDLVAYGAANNIGLSEVAAIWRTYKGLRDGTPVPTEPGEEPPHTETTPAAEATVDDDEDDEDGPTEAELAELEEAMS